MRITEMKLTPIAVPDPPLRNSWGIHEPIFMRVIIQLRTDNGLEGLLVNQASGGSALGGSIGGSVFGTLMAKGSDGSASGLSKMLTGALGGKIGGAIGNFIPFGGQILLQYRGRP